MNLLPTDEQVIRVLRETGALRHGHFEYPDGLHSNEYIQVPIAMRYYQHAKTLSVGLSRLLRANSEIRAAIPELSIVSPAPGGLPVAYGVCEALRARQVYWAERVPDNGHYRFRQFIQPEKGENVVLVDDILRSGRNLSDLKATLDATGANVMAVAVVISQPRPETASFGGLPVYSLAKLGASYYARGETCELCQRGIALEKVWV